MFTVDSRFSANGKSGESLALRLRRVSKTFGGVRALDRVDFEVKRGEVHCLAGENGSGKSTLIKIVTGVYAPDPGMEISVFGELLSDITPTRAHSLGIAVIWQDLSLFPHMSVAENIAFESMVTAVPRFVGRRVQRRTAQAALNRLGIHLDLSARLNSLSIAQRQMVAIARALRGESRLVFMDEPTSSLTQSETNDLLKVVRNLSSHGVAVVFVSHRLAEVLKISQRVTVLRDGKLVGVFSTEGMTQARLGELMTGTTLSAEMTARNCSDQPPVLETSRLTRQGEFYDVSLVVRRGEVVGITGLIGAGRTELAHAIIGMTRPDSGQILLEGQPLAPHNIRQAIRAGIAYVPEDRLALGLIQPQSISDNASISVLSRLIGFLGFISTRKKTTLVAHWLKELAIKIGQAGDAASTLSGGNQQRLVLAKWLATEPKLLILDSPTVGVDVGARAGIFRIIHQLAQEGLAILMISDEVTEVMLNADRVLHMAHGRILGEIHPRSTSINAVEAQIYG